MKRRMFLIFMACLIWFPGNGTVVKADAGSFRDIGQSYAENEIIDLFQLHVIDGTGPGVFEPAKSVSRAEFIKMLAGVLHLEQVNNSIPVFQDVHKTDWYYGWVYAALNLGLVDGKSDALYAPDDTITREQAAAIMARAFKQSPGLLGVPYRDKDSISSWALPHVAAVTQSGLMEGYDQSFYPQKSLTREETAVLLKRVSDRLVYEPPANPPVQLGWKYGGSASDFEQDVKNSNVNVISPRWFFLEKDGSVSNYADTVMVEWAHGNQKKVWPLVGNRFDTETTHTMLTARKEETIGKLADYVSQYQLDGLNLDFESLAPEDRDALTQFAGNLADKLHAAGKTLTIDVPPDLQTDWSRPYDYAALSRITDYLVLMNYEEHWDGSDMMGSVSSMSWFAHSMQQMLKEIPASKMIVGVPLYTRDWSASTDGTHSADTSLKEQERLFSKLTSIKWDSFAGQYVFQYNENGQHTIWMEDSRSLSLKYAEALSQTAAGFAYWYMGSETGDIWAALRNAERYRNSRLK